MLDSLAPLADLRGRSFGVLVLLAMMAMIAGTTDAVQPGRSMRAYAELGQSYFIGLIGVESHL